MPLLPIIENLDPSLNKEPDTLVTISEIEKKDGEQIVQVSLFKVGHTLVQRTTLKKC